MARLVQLVLLLTLSLGLSATAVFAACDNPPGGYGGFASSVAGGAGQAIYHVTNLNDSGSGSLRGGLGVSNRCIVFDVSGTIVTTSGQMNISGDHITIDGNTAPGDGILIHGHGFNGQGSGTNNIIIRGLKIRTHDWDDVFSEIDGIEFFQNNDNDRPHHIVITGNSFRSDSESSWSTDGVVDLAGANDVTVSWNILSHFSHGSDTHGMLVQGNSSNITFHHNLMIRTNDRKPILSYEFGRPGPTAVTADIRNNLVVLQAHGSGARGTEINEQSWGNVVNNYYDMEAGTLSGDSRTHMGVWVCSNSKPSNNDVYGCLNTGARAYVSGNVAAFPIPSGFPQNYSDWSTEGSPFSFAAVTPFTDATTAACAVRDQAGKFPRDSWDLDLISAIRPISGCGVVEPPPSTSNRFASPSGGSGSCTSPSSPCSLANAVSAWQPGETLELQGGNYTNGFVVPCGKSTAASPSTIRVSDGATVKIRGRMDMSDNDCGEGQHNMTITGQHGTLSFDQEYANNFLGLRGSNGWVDVTLRDFEIARTQHHGMFPPQNATISNLHIHHIGVDANGNPIPGVENFCGTNGPAECHGIYANNNNGPFTVENSRIHDVHGWGIIAENGVFTVRNNIIHGASKHNQGGGIYSLFFQDGSSYYNNVIYGMNGTALSLGHNANAFNNTIYGTQGLSAVDGGNRIQNNLAFNSSSNISVSGSGNTVDHNLCNVAGGPCNLGTTDPRFVDAPGGDFHLRNDSPAINAGVTASGVPATDIEGNPRPEPDGSVKDIGAYECQNVIGASCGGGPPQPSPGTVVAWYDFEVGTGTSVPDVTGFGHTGAWNECAGNACWGNGIIGTKAGVFNGSRYVQVTNTTGLKPTESIAMVARIALTGTGANGCDVVSIGDSAKIHVESNGNVSGQFYDGSTWREPFSTGRNVLDGGSHMLGMSYDGTGVRIRLDAGEVAFLPATGLISWTLGANLQIGRHGQGVGGYECTGRIDAVRILDGFCTTECFDSFYGEFVPSVGLAATHSRFEVPDAAEGTTFSGIGTDAPSIHVNRTGKVVQAWSLTRAGSTVPRYFPMFCAVPGFNGGAETKLTNSCGTFPVCIANDTLHNMGDSTGNFLPNDGLTNVAGRWVVDTIDPNSRTTLADGNRTEWRYEYQFSQSLPDATIVTCRPRDEDDSLLTSYPSTIPTITIDVSTLLGGQGSRVGGRSEGGKNQ